MVLNNSETSSVGERAARVNVESDLVNCLWYKATPPRSSHCPENLESSGTPVNAAFFQCAMQHGPCGSLQLLTYIVATSQLRMCPRVFLSPSFGGAMLKNRFNLRSKVFVWGYARYLDLRRLNMASMGSSA